MPYYPTTVPGPRALLASPGSPCWLLGGLTPNADPTQVEEVYGEAIAAGASIAASPAFNPGRSVNTFSLQTYVLSGAATVVVQASMTNRTGDFATITAVNGVYQTNLPFVRVLLSAITAGSIAVAIIF